jgi:hypothetical protein
MEVHIGGDDPIFPVYELIQLASSDGLSVKVA